MALPVELGVSLLDPAALRLDYESGKLSKLAYNSALWSIHQRLFEYSRFLSGTNVEAIELRSEGIIVRLRDPQIQLWCTPRDERHVAITSLNFRQYESEELRAVMRLARTCKTVYDVGANTGFYSIALGQRFPDARIFAFEPIPFTYTELQRNLTLNNITNVLTHNLGLSDRSCDEPFYFDVTVPGATSGAPLGPEFGITQTIIRPVETIDDFSARTGTIPDFVKCDVEGGELRVFLGAQKTLERFKPMIYTEMLRKWSARFGYHPNDIIEFFRQRDYLCFVICDSVLQPFLEMTEETIETNFFFLHERHLEMVRFLGLLE